MAKLRKWYWKTIVNKLLREKSLASTTQYLTALRGPDATRCEKLKVWTTVVIRGFGNFWGWSCDDDELLEASKLTPAEFLQQLTLAGEHFVNHVRYAFAVMATIQSSEFAPLETILSELQEQIEHASYDGNGKIDQDLIALSLAQQYLDKVTELVQAASKD